MATVEENSKARQKKIELRVTGMTCSTCAATIEKGLAGTPGVKHAEVNFPLASATVEYDPSRIDHVKIEKVISDLGYGVAVKKSVFPVRGMTCATCAAHVEEALLEVHGVISATVNLATEKATVEYTDHTNLGELRQAVKEAGYELGAETETIADTTALARQEYVSIRNRLAVSLVLAAIIMGLMYAPAFLGKSLLLWALATPVQFWAGLRFYRGAWGALRHRTADMNTLVAVGTSAAYFYSVAVLLFPGFFMGAGLMPDLYFDTSATIIALILLGRFLETRAKGQTTEAIKKLMGLRPKYALVLRDGQEVEVPVEDVSIGDLVRVRPGERVPVDGIIREGHSAVDESMITGESIPVEKGPGEEVIGASINRMGSFVFETTRVGKDTTLSQIIKLVEEAQGSKAPIQRLADVIASYFVPAVVSISLVTFLVWFLLGPEPRITFALLNFIAVLIIACPCALGLATPTAITVGTGRGAEHGILVRNAEALERSQKIDTVLMDKTGTLTVGRPEVIRIIPAPPLSTEDVLRLAAATERGSEHPLARAIVRAAEGKNLEVSPSSSFTAIPGYGVEAEIESRQVSLGNLRMMRERGFALNGLEAEAASLQAGGATMMFLAFDGKVAGAIALADTLKPNAAAVVATLHRMGVKTAMLTGDNRATAEAIAHQAGVERVLAEVLPEHKSSEVKRLQEEGRVVAMVGDGINDAPALAQADVGIAIGTGTDIAIETADITLISGDLSGVVTAISLARRTMRTIKQNLFWAFAYNTILIPVAAGILYLAFGQNGAPARLSFILGGYGFLNPVLAAAAMAISSVTVVTNSLRLKRFRPAEIQPE